MSDNTADILKAFSGQAAKFDAYQNNTFKNAFCEKAIAAMELRGNESVLEVAAGTCAFGRMIAQHVKSVTELDLTKAMLDAGKKSNEEKGIMNASYVLGNAECIPFEDAHFDAVITRLSFHHFSNPEKVMSEIARVLKPGGVAAIVDMIPPFEENREKFDHLEILRDPSHVRCYTVNEFSEMYRKNGIVPEKSETEIIPMDLVTWMDLTDTPADVQDEIRDALTEDLDSGISSGMDPYIDDGNIMFRRHWMYLIGIKLI